MAALDADDPERVAAERHAEACEGMRSFQASYESERGASFDGEERRHLDAAVVYGAAYTARCELSDAMTDFGAHPPAPASAPDGAMTTFLRAHGEELLKR